ncbi:sugar phosphate isomerase/epimerase [Zafaria sp. J156]|uniref:sugar phosphate isomerase/epimerase family protein n=1 Tax=Zafaria sp. J156 TaxID=3116490 RepID=UPI002E7697E7|nr:sugar phosphate isomerase/epimerase [Zafaria sp. J156]MEE1621798.1 sugar phosphate isomerase/epimerase [Zafaria sp. J156]
MARIGVQAMMLKNSFTEIGAYETLAKVAEIGYRAVEVSQIPMDAKNTAELERARDVLGVEVAALSVNVTATGGAPVDALDTDFAKIVDDAHRLGTRHLRIGMLPLPAMASLEKTLEFARTAEGYAQRLQAEGLGLYYHNHHVEFAKVEGRHLLDHIREVSPTMGLEIDVHWVQRGGLDPVRTLRRYAGQAPMVHLKDYRIGALPESAFGHLQSGDFPAFMQDFRNVVQFAEVGEGNLDFAEIIPEAVLAGAEYLLVEQDELYGRTVWEALQTSYDNLNTLGFGDLFAAPAQTVGK